MRSVVERKVVMRFITVYLSGNITQKFFCNSHNVITSNDATLPTVSTQLLGLADAQLRCPVTCTPLNSYSLLRAKYF